MPNFGAIIAHDVDGRWTLDPLSRRELVEVLDDLDLEEPELREALASEPGVIFVVASAKGLKFEAVCEPPTEEAEDDAASMADAREISAWLKAEDRVLVFDGPTSFDTPKRADLVETLVATGGARLARELRTKGHAYVIRNGSVARV